MYEQQIDKQSAWIRQQYGFTSKADLIQQITEIILNPGKRQTKTQKTFLEEAVWQLAHLEFVVGRISEDYADLLLMAERMADALMSVQESSAREVTNALAEWTAFHEWLYDQGHEQSEEDDEGDEA